VALRQESVTPWDRGALQAPLQKLVESGRVSLPTSGRAIVPGCGRGYEVVYIANTLHLDTIGLDLSSTAIRAAQQCVQSFYPHTHINLDS